MPTFPIPSTQIRFNRIVGLVDFPEVQPLFQDRRAMKTFKDGIHWPNDKIQKYLSYFQKEGLKSDYIDWRISNKNKTVGVVSIQPALPFLWNKYNQKKFVTILIGSEFWKQGFGKAGINFVIDRFRGIYPLESFLYAMINEDHTYTLRLFTKCGFQFDSKVQLKKGQRFVIFRKAMSTRTELHQN